METKLIGGVERPIRITYGVIFKTASDLKLKSLSELDSLNSTDIASFNKFLVNLYYYGLKAGAKSSGETFTFSKADVEEWLFDLDMDELTNLEYFNQDKDGDKEKN